MTNWIISNLQFNNWGNPVFKNPDFIVYVKQDVKSVVNNTIVNGQIIKRYNHFPEQDVYQISRGNLTGEINNYKGIFQLIKWDEKGFSIAGDHHGIFKWFVWKNDDAFILTNKLENISSAIDLSVSRKAIIDHCIFNRFVKGRTLWQNVTFSGMAEILEFDAFNKEFTKQNYWDYNELAKQKQSNQDFGEIAKTFQSILKDYLNKLNARKVSVPLTGGLDCRSALAAILDDKYSIQTYTYGHPLSSDTIIGKNTAEKLGLPFTNYHLQDKSLYLDLEQEIFEYGNSLVSSNRAHRLWGVKKETENADVMILGYLGGESVRGLWPDDLIISKAVRKTWEGKENITNIVKEAFNAAGLSNYSKDDLDYAITSLEYFNLKNHQKNYFRFLFEVKSHLHFAQDLYLFQKHTKPLPIFMDLDYLYLLFSSPYNLLNKHSMTKNKLKKLSSPEYNCNIIYRLNKNLAKIKTSNGFSPEEFVKNKYFAYLKRLRQSLKKKKFHANYRFEAWRVDLLRNNMAKDQKFALLPDGNLNGKDEKSLLPYTRVYDLSMFGRFYAEKQ